MPSIAANQHVRLVNANKKIDALAITCKYRTERRTNADGMV